jgi:ubiquinone/menaquinone biosynthesis C-methylase UbiE
MENSIGNGDQIKEKVKEVYTEVVNQPKKQNDESLCGVGGGSCCGIDYTIFSEDYTKLEGYCKNADLGLGCGNPTEGVKIQEGDVVLDLGCGAGNDCFIARNYVGKTGKVIGLDFTPQMLKKAWQNLDAMNFNNIEFRFGDIEDMPVADSIIDVVISNCVINLVPNKKKAFQEIHRVLKPSGFFTISDVVSSKELPIKIKNEANLYAGCVSGAIVKEDYLELIKNIGFSVEVRKEKDVKIPKDIMLQFLSEEEYQKFVDSQIKIMSITVVAKKIDTASEEKLDTKDEKKSSGCCSGNKTCG